jgi:hypothetical protein
MRYQIVEQAFRGSVLWGKALHFRVTGFTETGDDASQKRETSFTETGDALHRNGRRASQKRETSFTETGDAKKPKHKLNA